MYVYKQVIFIIIIIIMLLLGNSNVTFSQERVMTPSSNFQTLKKVIPEYICETSDIDSYLNQSIDDKKVGLDQLVFAKKNMVSLTPKNSGVWEEMDGLMTWRLKIKSKDAYSMMLIFEDLELHENSSLFIYDSKKEFIVGPYTSSYAVQTVLATPLIPSDEIIVELIYEISKSNTLPTFTIRSISHDFLNAYGSLNVLGGIENKILDCHNNINCPIGDSWQIEKRAVARMVVDGDLLCSGALVNTTESETTPYFLTANQCIANNADAMRSVFYFNFETYDCDGEDPYSDRIVSGAKRITFGEDSDYCLLELNARVPSSFRPFYAGWDRSDSNPSNTAIIHHPLGARKKISFDYDETTTYQLDLDFVNGEGNTILIPEGNLWLSGLDNGAIEGGSVGGPLFNSDGKIRGQITAGFGWCPGGEVIPTSLFCGKFSTSWNQGLNQFLASSGLNDPQAIKGLYAEGWRHRWPLGWNAPPSTYISWGSPMEILDGNQIFYTGPNSKIHRIFWSGSSWEHEVIGANEPSGNDVAGDLVVSPGGQVFYRGADGRMQHFYRKNGVWTHTHITKSYESLLRYPHKSAGSISYGTNSSQLIYRGLDNKLYNYYYANGDWNPSTITGPNDPPYFNVNGELEFYGNKVFYRAENGLMHHYYWSNNTWVHAFTGGVPVHKSRGAIAKETSGEVFFRGIDNSLNLYTWNGNIWEHSKLTTSSDQNVSGDIAVRENLVVYRGVDHKMHQFEKVGTEWVHDWLEASRQAPIVHNISGDIEIGHSTIFYRGQGGRMAIYQWENGFEKNVVSDDNSISNLPNSTSKSSYELNSEFNIDLYPNPATDYLLVTIESSEISDYSYQLMDMSGGVVKMDDMKNITNYKININDLIPGMYLLKIIDSSGEFRIEKFVKN